MQIIDTWSVSSPSRFSLPPLFHAMTFSDEGAMLLVSTHLRHAWTAVAPTSDTSTSAVQAFIANNHNRSPAERLAVPQHVSRQLHTSWRDSIYWQWKTIFWDTEMFLKQQDSEPYPYPYPHPHSLTARAFGMRYPMAEQDRNDERANPERLWMWDVLLVPAHLEPGVQVRMTTLVTVPEGEPHGDDSIGPLREKTLGVFDAQRGAEIWYLRRCTRVRFYVEGEFEDVRGGLAAAIVVGVLERGDERGEVMEEEEDLEHYERDAEEEDEDEMEEAAQTAEEYTRQNIYDDSDSEDDEDDDGDADEDEDGDEDERDEMEEDTAQRTATPNHTGSIDEESGSEED